MNFSAVKMASGKKKIQRNAGAGVARPFADDNLHKFLPSRVFALRHLAASLEEYVFPGNL